MNPKTTICSGQLKTKSLANDGTAISNAKATPYLGSQLDKKLADNGGERITKASASPSSAKKPMQGQCRTLQPNRSAATSLAQHQQTDPLKPTRDARYINGGLRQRLEIRILPACLNRTTGAFLK